MVLKNEIFFCFIFLYVNLIIIFDSLLYILIYLCLIKIKRFTN